MLVGERLLIAADAVGRTVLPLKSAGDIEDERVKDARFAGHLAMSQSFGEGFVLPFDVAGKVVLEFGCGHGGMQVHLLSLGVAKTIAVDIDAGFLEETRARAGEDPRLELVHAPIENSGVAEESVDVVVSSATFEHLSDVPGALREVRRILRPGGLMFVKVGQPWLHYNGPHLVTYIHVPWMHLMFRHATIVAVMERYRREGRYPAASIDARLEDLKHMNRYTIRRYERAFRASGMTVLQLENASPRRWKRRVMRLPVLRELLAGTLTAVLRKPERFPNAT